MEKGQGFSPEYNRFFTADKGNGSSPENSQEVLKKKQETLSDLNTVLSKVPEEARNDIKKYDEYKATVSEAKNRLKESGIDTDLYTKKDLQIGTKEGNKAHGQRKAELRLIVEKLVKGEDLSEEELKKTEVVNIKKDDLYIKEPTKEENVKVEPEKVIDGPWVAQLAFIDRVADPKLQKEMRNEWLMKNIRDGSIPYSVIEAQLAITNQEYEASKKENKNGENKQAEEKKDGKKVEMFSKEEEYLIIKRCYDLVFIGQARQPEDINKAILDAAGIVVRDLGRPKDPVLDPKLVERMNALGLENWIDMRNVFAHWAEFKGKEEVKENDLNSGMFMDVTTEAFFANKECEIPAKLDANGNLVNGEDGLVKVDLGKEIGAAMKIIRHHFADGLRDAKGRPQLVEYWRLIGDQPEKANLYKSLNINKYIGETAFALLTSYQMLTDTSAEDFMSMMVDQADTRAKKYKISEERDAFARMIVMLDMAKGKVPFTRETGDAFFNRRKETIDALARLLPAQLIPTGLSGDGMAQLERGNWLKWRVNENLYSRNQVDAAKIALNPVQLQFDAQTEKIMELENRVSQMSQEEYEELEDLKAEHARDAIRLAPLLEKVKPATDQGTRIDMMRSALTVLETMKAIVDPSSDINKLESLKGKLYRHMTGSFGDAKWLIDGKVPAAFSFLEADGTRRDIPLNEWISRTMMGVDKAFLYTHSIVDHKCTKPWEMKVFAQNAEQLFRNEVQSSKGTFLGQEKSIQNEHKKDMKKFIDTLWDYSYDLIDVLENPNNGPEKYPKWFMMGVSVDQNVKEVVKKAYADMSLSSWDIAKKRLGL